VQGAVGEGLSDAQGSDPRGRASRPVVGRHVAERETRVGQAGHRVGAAGAKVRPRQEAVDQHRRLVAGDGALAEERAVGERGVDAIVAQLTEGRSAPIVLAGLADDHAKHGEHAYHDQDLLHRSHLPVTRSVRPGPAAALLANPRWSPAILVRNVVCSVNPSHPACAARTSVSLRAGIMAT